MRPRHPAAWYDLPGGAGPSSAGASARGGWPMIGGLGWQELLIILVIIALIFGASRVADLGGALGRGIREFRQEAGQPDDGSTDGAESDAPAASSSDAAPPPNETADTSSDRDSSG